jgi:Tol biopolymer transport system component
LEIRFIDKPDDASPVGIWGVPFDQPLAEPTLVSERIELSTALPDYLIEIEGASTTIERMADGERWTVPAQGRTVRISPDRSQIAWSITNADLEPERQVAAIWVAKLDGSAARQVATLPRGGVSGWISDDVLLVSGRESLQAQEQTLSALSLADGATTELARAERLRGQVLSPSGRWIVYYTTFDADPSKNGMWLVRTDGSERRQLDRTLFGAYQWRGCLDPCGPNDDRLLVVPFDPAAAYHHFVEVNPATGDAKPLTDPAATPFKIANGDWRVSPDGRYVAFGESSDRNIWVIELPR